MNGNGNGGGIAGFENLRGLVDETEIRALFHNPFYDPESPLAWRSLFPGKAKSLLSKCPFLPRVKTFLEIIGEEGSIKLT